MIIEGDELRSSLFSDIAVKEAEEIKKTLFENLRHILTLNIDILVLSLQKLLNDRVWPRAAFAGTAASLRAAAILVFEKGAGWTNALWVVVTRASAIDGALLWITSIAS